VVQVLAERDPVAAMALLDSIPPQDRDRVLQAIASNYGRQNPEMAMAWARSLSPPSQAALSSVLQGIAAVDMDRAIDLIIAEMENTGAPGNPLAMSSTLPLTLMMSMVTSGTGDPGRLADRLLGLNDPMMRSMLSSTMSMWAQTDTEGALNWAIANARELDPSAFSNLARQMARDDINLAMSTLERLPLEQRGGWIAGLAGQLAQSDINQAVSLLERLRGQSGYDSAVAAVARELARNDPVAAAKMISDAPPSNELMASTFMVAREWAQRDPATAAVWALELGDPRAQTQSLNVIAQSWAERDSAEARQWLLGLASGSTRDAALDGYLSAMAQGGEIDRRLVDAYSSDEAGQRGASRAIMQIGRTDPVAANRLLEQYITDDAIREQTEQSLARMSGSGSGGILISDGGVIFLQ
jgi:hypothetical protein